MNSEKTRKYEAGFTILELVVAVALLGLMMGLVAGSFYGASKAKRRTEAKMELIAMGRMSLNLMIKDLNGAYIDPQAPDTTPIVGEQSGSYDNPDDSISFTTTTFDPRQFGIGGNIAVIDYWLEENTELEGTYFLMRKADPFPDQDLKEGGFKYDIAEQLTGLSIRYQDDNKTWNSRWDSDSALSGSKLPRLIEITLHLKGEDGVTVQLQGYAAPMAYRPAEAKMF